MSFWPCHIMSAYFLLPVLGRGCLINTLRRSQASGYNFLRVRRHTKITSRSNRTNFAKRSPSLANRRRVVAFDWQLKTGECLGLSLSWHYAASLRCCTRRFSMVSRRRCATSCTPLCFGGSQWFSTFLAWRTIKAGHMMPYRVDVSFAKVCQFEIEIQR